ncbi:hypothetical protein ACFLX3_05170 [Chloroflexota bacterium]
MKRPAVAIDIILALFLRFSFQPGINFNFSNKKWAFQGFLPLNGKRAAIILLREHRSLYFLFRFYRRLRPVQLFGFFLELGAEIGMGNADKV